MKRIVAALAAVALIGCGTAQKKPDSADVPKQEPTGTENAAGSRAAKGAVGGAAIGAVGCLSLIPMGLFGGPLGLVMVPVAIACVPVGVVAGAVVGGTAVAVSDATRRGTPSTAHAGTHDPSSDYSAWKPIGRLAKNDAIPAGTLHFSNALRTAQNKPAVRLLVDFDERSERGERSYMAYATVSCQNGALSFYSRATYSEWGGNGWRVTSEFRDDGALFVIDKANDAFPQVFQQACE